MRRQRKIICLGLILVLASSVRCVLGNDLVVPSGSYPTIQSAIDGAVDYEDRVVVSVGTYYENINFGGKAITVSSTDPNDPEIVATTIIDGSVPTDPDFGSTVTFNSGESNDSVLTGFTITGGSGTWLVIAWEFHEPYWNRCGGGIVCYNMSEPTITGNVISDNLAGEGGGIYVYGDPVDMSNPSNPAVHLIPVISDNTFDNNSAIREHGYLPPDENYVFAEHGDGGAIVCFQGVDPTISNNIIENNHADYYGGGLHLRQWSDGKILNNQIVGNNSTLGAGVHVTYMASPVVCGNLIKSNITSGGGGGGLYIYYYSNPIIEFNVIAENSCWQSAGIGIYWDSEPLIHGNLIVNNAGLGILCNGNGTIKITNNTITDNGSNFVIGGIKCHASSAPLIENNIISSNEGYGIYKESDSTPTIRYNDIWNNAEGDYSPNVGNQTGKNGNISVDPLFVNTAIMDYHLKSNGWRWDQSTNNWTFDTVTSRCIDAGNAGYVLGDELLVVPNDTEGLRAVNLRINIGAYGGRTEASLAPHQWSLLCDVTNDGIVNLFDFSVEAKLWFQNSQNLPADFNRNLMVNISDFISMANDWLDTTTWH